MAISQDKIEQFLYREARLLDQWKLKEWAELFTDDGKYFIPPLGDPEADHQTTLFLVADDRDRIQARVERLLKKEAHIEFPHSVTCHNISNVLIDRVENGIIYVDCNFIVHRTKREKLHIYIGHLKYQLVESEESLRIKEKRVVITLDTLRPQGKVSIVL